MCVAGLHISSDGLVVKIPNHVLVKYKKGLDVMVLFIEVNGSV